MKGNLKCGRSLSCGCLRREVASSTFRKLPIKESTAKEHYLRYKNAASRMGRDFFLSIDQFYELSSKACFYCGENPKEFVAKSMGEDVASGYIANGLDRIDSSEGYTTTNVVACCFRCNSAKSNSLQKDFIDMCLSVARIHGGDNG